jgi:anaerobic selenocysteine-containing dehydrogenase/Fe-S-cluster-containing dehydrogenase component
MLRLGRRDFLKVIGAAGASTTLGCSSELARNLIPYVFPPEEIVPGDATWFASTCRECPAGCGLLAKNRDGRIIKVEGNPAHPISGGKLCARGQASVHGLYNPDRFKGPMKRVDGELIPITWDEAELLLMQRLHGFRTSGSGKQAVFITQLMTGTLQQLVEWWLEQTGSGEYIPYESYAYEDLRAANEITFGRGEIPDYRIDQADFLISFGAGFLETWVSNIKYARQFAEFHAPADSNKHAFVYVGPRQSMTAANADLCITVAPGDEYLIGLAIISLLLDDERYAVRQPFMYRPLLQQMRSSFTTDQIIQKTGVSKDVLQKTAQRFAAAKRPLALAGGLACSSPNSLATAVAANLLCGLKAESLQAIDFSRPHSLSRTATADKMWELTQRIQNDEIELLLLHEANPVFTLPPSWRFAESLHQVPFIVSCSSCPDETTELAHLILPTHTPLESWGDYIPQPGVVSLLQPVMGNVYDTRHLGDILLSTGNKLTGEEKLHQGNFHQLLQASWEPLWREYGGGESFTTFWINAAAKGGVWDDGAGRASPAYLVPSFKYEFPPVDDDRKEKDAFCFTAYPPVQFYDGRMANRPWIQELPDPVTQVTWGGWVEINPDTAMAMGIKKGDLIRLKSEFGSVEAPALPIPTVPERTLAMPIGQGHLAYGRYATGLPANPLQLYPADPDRHSGGIHHPRLVVSIEQTGELFGVANTDGSFFDHDRHLVQEMQFPVYQQAVQSGHRPHIDLPLPAGYTSDHDIYPPHSHPTYRWTMVVDLDRCIGCGACVVACYAENNVAVVGREQMLLQREMSWLRVQRYFKHNDLGIRYLVMLCQHCDAAPCESVCPIFAPHHSIEGLNNQIYNRCFGTRFCSQNDPYKVRRFNWFTFTRAEPLHWQLNPDVTVRQKGVMEKCSFCIQRITKAKIEARNKGRLVQDGDFTTACAQTCPTNALTFGNLIDPNSRVSQLINNPRAYQVLQHLNTKPAVIYLKRITQEV